MLNTIYLVYCYEGLYEYYYMDGKSDDSYSDDKLIAAFSSKQDALDYCAQMPNSYIETEEEDFYSEKWCRYYVRDMPIN